jgi:hypothetical protein
MCREVESLVFKGVWITKRTPKSKRSRRTCEILKAAGPVSRILSAELITVTDRSPVTATTYRRTAIPLGRALLRGSSDLPEGCGAPSRHAPANRVPSYLVLLRVGFALPAASLQRRCALTAPFHPYPAAVSCWRSCHQFVVTAALANDQRLMANDERPNNSQRQGGVFSVALSVG